MAVVTLAQVQQWLEATKLTIGAFDTELELTAERIAFSALASQYDASVWTSTGNTPVLVQEVIAMLVAAWTYQRQYSEDGDAANWYSVWLEGKAMALLSSIVGGNAVLTDSTQLNKGDTPTFFPDDAATNLSDPNLNGDPNDPYGAHRAFSMQDRF